MELEKKFIRNDVFRNMLGVTRIKDKGWQIVMVLTCAADKWGHPYGVWRSSQWQVEGHIVSNHAGSGFYILVYDAPRLPWLGKYRWESLRRAGLNLQRNP